MPTTSEANTTRCPSCGAPVASATAERCAFCGGLLLSRPRRIAESAPLASSGLPPVVPRTRSFFLWVAFLVVTVGGSTVIRLVHSVSRPGVVPVIGGSSPAEKGSAAVPPHIDEPVDFLPADGASDVLLTLVGDQHPLSLYDGRTHKARWQGGAFSKSVDPDATAFDGVRIYAADQSRLTALRRDNGQVLWQTSLVTELASRCRGCLVARKGRVVALQKDGSLQAFDVATGQPAWSVRLLGTPSQLSEAGGLLAVSQPEVNGKPAQVLELRDPSDGSVVRTLKPSCRDRSSRTSRESERPNSWSPTLFSQDGGRTAFFFFGSASPCGQAWDVSTGEQLWSTYLPPWRTVDRFVAGDRRILFSLEDGSVGSLDTAHGTFVKLSAAAADQSLLPLQAFGDTALLMAAAKWDSNRVTLLSVDPATGATRWRFAVSAVDASSVERYGPRSIWRTWWAAPISGGLAVAQVLDAHHLSIDVLNLQTGASAGRKILPVADKPHGAWLQDRMAWFQVYGRLEAVTLPDATVAYELP
jgi:outer membrane protein assembly factor BamB